MPQEPRDFAQWTKSVERRLQQALRAGQSPQAVRLAQDLQRVREEVKDIEAGDLPQPAAPVELVTQTRVLPDLAGTPRGEVGVSFAPVTVSVDAEPIDVDRYELWIKDLKEQEEEEGDPNDDSWRTNLVDDPDPIYWGGREAPRAKQVADLREGVDFAAGDRIRFTVIGDTYGFHPLEGFNELEHSVRLSAHRKVYEGDPMPWDIEEDEDDEYPDEEGESEEEEEEEDPRDFEIVEHTNWRISRLPSGYEGGGSDRSLETYTVEGVIPKGTTRITAHIAVTMRVGYSEFLNPVIVNMSEVRPDATGQGTKMVSTSIEPELIYSPLDVGGQYQVQVRAVASGRPGPLSATRTVTVAPDRTPPPIPSTLELSSSGATVTASWDRLAGTGDPMPVDFSHTEVAYGYLPPPTEVAGSISNLFSQYIFETPPQPSDVDFDGTWYFRHRAVDTSGNKSPWSATSSIVPKSLVDEAALRFELEEFNRERIDPLESSINDEVRKAQEAVQAFRDEWNENWDPEAIAGLESRQGTLESDLEAGLAQANKAVQDFRDEWDENWDPEAIDGLRQRADELENKTEAEYLRLQDQVDRAMAAAGANLLPDPKFDTDYWVENQSPGMANAEEVHKLPVDGSMGEPRSGEPGAALVIRPGVDGRDPWPEWIERIPVEAGQVWRFSGWVRTAVGHEYTTTDTGSDWAAIQDSQGNRTTTSGPGGFTWRDVTTRWQRFSVDHVILEDVSWITVIMRIRKGEGVLVFDDFQVQDITQVHEVLQRLEGVDQMRDDLMEEIVTAAGKIVVRSVSPATSFDPHNYFVGTRFEQWSATSADAEHRTILRTWHASTASDGGIEWIEVALDETYIPQIAIGQGTYGDLSGGRLTARSVKAASVDMEEFTANSGFINNAFINLVQGKQADFENLFVDSFIAESATVSRQIVASRNLYNDPTFEKASLYSGWEVINGGIEKNGTGALSGTYASTMEMMIPAEPGELFEVSVEVEFLQGSNHQAYIYTRSANADGNYIGGSAAGSLRADSNGRHTATFNATDDAHYVYIGFYTHGNMTSSDRVRFTNPRVQSTLDGRLVVDNTLKARHVDMADFTADQGFIDNAFVRLIEGELANYDQGIIGNVLLKDGAVSARNMAIGNMANLIGDTQFEDEWGMNGGWQVVVGEDADFTRAYWASQYTRIIRTGQASDYSIQVRYGQGRLNVLPGEHYRFEASTFGAMTNGRAIGIRVGYTGDFNGFIWQDSRYDWPSGLPQNTRLDYEWAVPDDNSIKFMFIQIMLERTVSSGHIGIYHPMLRNMSDGNLIVQNSIKSRNLDVQEIFFDSAVGNAIAAGSGRFLTIQTGNLASNAVTADKLNFGSLNGVLITGLQIQTHTNNRGVKITSAGIRAFNSSGTETFTVSASNGSITARNANIIAASFEGGSIDGTTITGGQFRTAASIFGNSNGGVRIQGDNSGGRIDVTDSSGNLVLRAGDTGAEIRGHIEAQSMSLSGALRVGGNGEGGIVPDGNRTRFVGRTPRTTGPDDTMAYGRTGTLSWSPGSNPIYIRVTYETPSSLGRTPLATLHTTNNIFRRNGGGFTVTTGERGSARFTIRVQHGGGWDTTIQGWTSYLAYLGDPPNSGGSVET